MTATLSERLAKAEQANAEKTKLIEKCQRVMSDVASLLQQQSSIKDLPKKHALMIIQICLHIIENKKKISEKLSQIEHPTH